MMGRNTCFPPRRTPSFFKVLIGDFCMHLRIPPAFTKHFDGNVPQKCVLWSSTNRSWNVNLEKIDDLLLFQEGWSSFVQDNSLEIGDFLLFRYAGNSQFYVEMYGKNCCEKDATTKAIMKGQNPSQPQQSIKKESANTKPVLDGYSTRHTKRKRTFKREDTENDNSVKKECSRGMPAEREQSVDANHKFSALQRAQAFESKCPFFIVYVKPPSIRSRFSLNVPSDFAKKYIRKEQNDVILRGASDGRTWSAKCYRRIRGDQRSLHWFPFVRDNYIKPGDACVFELIKSNEASLNVIIFRAAE